MWHSFRKSAMKIDDTNKSSFPKLILLNKKSFADVPIISQNIF